MESKLVWMLKWKLQACQKTSEGMQMKVCILMNKKAKRWGNEKWPKYAFFRADSSLDLKCGNPEADNGQRTTCIIRVNKTMQM